LNRLLDLDKIVYRGDDIEGNLNAILFNLPASTIPERRTFKLVRCVQILNRLVDLDKILYCGNGIKGDLDHSNMGVFLSVCIVYVPC
jgi:hypothetical protein